MIQAMSLDTFLLNDFSGGVNVVDNPYDLDATEMAFSGTSDIEIVGKGARIRARNGMKKMTTSTLVAPTTSQTLVRNMIPYRPTGAAVDNIVMSTALGRIITWDNVTQSLTQRLAATVAAGGADHIWYFEQAADAANTQYVYCLNGLDTPQKMLVSSAAVSNWTATSGTVPNGTFHKIWKNMMIVAGVAAQPQRLYYSTIANPDSWPANNFIDIKSTDDEDDSIIALEVIGENLVVFKQNSVWVVFDSVTFDNRRVSGTGCVNRFAHTSVGDTVYWVSPTGVFSTDGDTVNHESRNIDPVWNSSSMGNVTLNDARMASVSDRVFLIPNRTYMWVMYLDMTRPDKQHPWMYNIHRLSQNRALCSGNFNNPGAGQPESLMLMLPDDSITEQTLFEWGSKYAANDDDWNVAFSIMLVGAYSSKALGLVGVENMERIRRINVYGISQGNGITVNLLDAGGSATFSQVINTDNGSSYGYARVRPEFRARAERLWLNFTNPNSSVGTNPLEISEIEIKYRGGKEH